MRSLPWLFLCVVAVACTGEPAPDADVCRDVAHRLCLAQACPEVSSHFALDGGCEASLLSHSGCDHDDFAFSSPTRTRFLDCRAPLIRGGLDRELTPTCKDVGDSLSSCPEVVTFFGGGTP